MENLYRKLSLKYHPDKGGLFGRTPLGSVGRLSPEELLSFLLVAVLHICTALPNPLVHDASGISTVVTLPSGMPLWVLSPAALYLDFWAETG